MNIESPIEKAALKVLQTNRVAVFIVAYNASKHIEKVLQRIPPWVAEGLAQIYLIDDSSQDETAFFATQVDWPSHFAPLKIFTTPFNQGYGGNQKIGYSYAINQGFDIVVLLHGDGQYAPEALPHLLAEYNVDIDAVFGSRFINPGDALKGGMPLYKFVGNRVLSGLQNYFMKGSLSEWHSGYRSYRTSLLKRLPFSCNSNDFDFDAEIIIQTLGAGGVIKEVPIPTFYGDEICHVNGLQYAAQCMKNVFQYRAMQAELFYDPRFDVSKPAQDLALVKNRVASTVDLFVEGAFSKVALKTLKISSAPQLVDSIASKNSLQVQRTISQLELGVEKCKDYDALIVLDVLQNQSSPERALQVIGQYLKADGIIYVSCANVAYFPVRIMLLCGYFNYGRKGILDKVHQRLFTKASLIRLLVQGGFEITAIHGFGPPIADKIGQSFILRALDRVFHLLAKIWTSLFAFEILIVAKKNVNIEWLLQETTNDFSNANRLHQ
jgi:glycosyltransferase involved in cell wall biosynthesis